MAASNRFNTIIKRLHIFWLILWAAVFTLMVLQAGHSLEIIFAPFAIIAGAIGHLFLWLLVYLNKAGTKTELKHKPGEQDWPPLIIVAIAVLAYSVATTLPFAVIGLFKSPLLLFSTAVLIKLSLLALNAIALYAIWYKKPWGYQFILTVCMANIFMYGGIIVYYFFSGAFFSFTPITIVGLLAVYLSLYIKSENTRQYFAFPEKNIVFHLKTYKWTI